VVIYGRDAKCSALPLHAAFFSYADQFQWQTISRQANPLSQRNWRWNKSSLKSLNVGAWVRARPQSALWFHYANRLVISALGRAINSRYTALAQDRFKGFWRLCVPKSSSVLFSRPNRLTSA
jgi:hypothetical protein